MKRRTVAGLTLVEVLVVAVIAALVLWIGFSILLGSSGSFERCSRRLGTRESALLALSSIRAAVQGAWRYRVAEGGRSAVFEGPGGRGLIAFDAPERRVLVIGPGRTPQLLCSGAVADLSIVSAAQGELHVRIAIESAPPSASAQPIVFMEDTIAIPAILQRRGDVPFTVLMASPLSQLSSR